MQTNYRDQLIEALQKLDANAPKTEILKATSGVFKKTTWVSSIGRIAFLLGVLSGIFSILLITNVFGFGVSKTLNIVLYSCWTILPPSWFMYEYTWLFPDALKYDPTEMADLKYKHDLAAKIWGGLVLVMTAILLSNK